MNKVFIIFGCIFLFIVGCASHSAQERHLKLLREKTEMITELRAKNIDLENQYYTVSQQLKQLDKMCEQCRPTAEEIQEIERFHVYVNNWAQTFSAVLADKTNSKIEFAVREFVFLNNYKAAVITVNTNSLKYGFVVGYAFFYKIKSEWHWVGIDFIPPENQQQPSELLPEDAKKDYEEEL